MTLADLKNVTLDVDAAGVALVSIDRKGDPVNTLGPELAAELFDVVAAVETDAAVRAVVIASGKPSGFLAGADIRWLRSLDDAEAALGLLRRAHAGFLRLEELSTKHGKPVVAAIHGACLGGGLELALACSMRICSADDKTTQLGQPEVQLGLIPGAAGTQRLPRLVGVAAGLDLILSGRSARPRKARRIGLVDEVVPKELLLDVAKRRAVEAIDAQPVPGGVDRLKAWLAPAHLQQLALEENPVGRRVLVAKAESKMLEQTKGHYPAPPAALRAVRAGVEEGFAQGSEVELEEFAELVVSPEAKSLISIFFATRAMKKETGIDSDAEPRTVDKVAVLGGGLMGGGIAAVNTSKAAVTTRIKEIDDAGARRGLQYVQRTIDRLVNRRRLKPRDAAKAMQLVTATTDWSGFGDVDLVIEAVFEDLELKQSMLQQVEGVARPDTIFASNTSSIPISTIAQSADRPENVVGMHYFSPVEKMPLLEVVVTPETSDDVIATVVDFGKRQGKTVIVVNDGPGFYTTRILGPYFNEVSVLLSEGVPIEDIDGAVEAWGFPVGPVLLTDEVGIDVAGKIAKVMEDAFGDRMKVPESFERLAADDRKGRKNGRGFYRYEKGHKVGPDDSVYAVLGVEKRVTVPRREVQDRIVLQLINEAARCLEEGILRTAQDGDVGAVYGLGFPPFRAGPFAYVDQVGAPTLVARMEQLVAIHGPRFEPAGILRQHAASGAPFRI